MYNAIYKSRPGALTKLVTKCFETAFKEISVSNTVEPIITVRTMITTGVVSPSESGAESEVGKFDVSSAVNEHVIWLDVAVYEAHPVHALNRQNQLRDEKLRQSLVKDAQSDQQTHQVTTRYVLHHEIQVRRVLEPPFKWTK